MQINLTPDPSLLAIMVIFILNYLIVRKFFLQPVNHVLEARQHETRSADEIYEQAMDRFNEATAKMEARLHEARREASQLRERFRAEANNHRAITLERTHEEAKSLVAQANEKLTRDVAEARETIIREADSLARNAAERILGRAV